MTAVETRPVEPSGDSAAAEGAAAAAPVPLAGLTGLLGTSDHKVVGRLFIGASLLFGVAASVVGGLLGAERVDTSSLDVLGVDTFAQVFTLHSIAAVFLFLIPLIVGVALVVVPLQIGAATVAFPRAATAAFWGWLLSGGVLLAAYGINGGPFGGDAEAVDLSLLAFIGVIASLLLAVVCIVTTVVALRTSGMTLDRVPLFSWSMLVAGAMWLLSLPVLVATLVYLYVDHHYDQVLFGGAAGVYGRVLWVFGQPQLYAFAVPALGVIGEVVPVFARQRPRLHGVFLALIGLVGALGFGAWTQVVAAGTTGATNASLVDEALYGIMAVAIVVPLLGLAGGWADTLRRGRADIQFGAPLVFAVASLLMMLAGAVAGAVSIVEPLELLNPDTTWRSAQAHYVLVGVLIALIGAAHYWAPKLFGRVLKAGLGTITAVVLLLGTVLLSLPDIVSGLLDQPTFSPGGDVRDGVEALNVASVAGGGLVLIGVLLFVANLLTSLKAPGDDVADDPWQGHTLEWLTASPPAAGNFGDLPEVTSSAPLLDTREAS